MQTPSFLLTILFGKSALGAVWARLCLNMTSFFNKHWESKFSGKEVFHSHCMAFLYLIQRLFALSFVQAAPPWYIYLLVLQWCSNNCRCNLTNILIYIFRSSTTYNILIYSSFAQDIREGKWFFYTKNCHIFHKIHIFHIAFHCRVPKSPKFCVSNALKCNAAQNSRNIIQYFGNLLAPTTICIAI
jgi:hypothetical protein